MIIVINISFHYDPIDKSKKTVSSRPATMTYLVDRPSHIRIDDFPKAIADAIYLLSFSPMLGAVKSDLDNYDKQ